MTSHTPTPWTESNYSDIRGADNFLVGMTNPIGAFAELSKENRAFIIRACNSHDEALAALRNVNKLISEAAMTGFNWKDGDWADRLFHSQQKTSTAIAKAEARS